MTRICLVRHGETDWNAAKIIQGKTDIPLNERGMQQAEECAKRLAIDEFDILITSPLKRAAQTASIINKRLQLPLRKREAFKERDFGAAEGMSKEEREVKYPDKNYPGLESREVLRKRVMAGIEEITRSYPNKHVLLVAHGAVINTILAVLSDGKIGSGKTKLTNGCISRVALEQEQWKIDVYNLHGHLTEYDKRD